MAIYCPAYHPEIGWHIVVMGPDGPSTKLISFPLQYYHSMNVSPPVGAVFSNEDYDDLDDYLNGDYEGEEDDIDDNTDLFPEYPSNSFLPNPPSFLPLPPPANA